MKKTRDSLQQGIYKVINPFVRFLIKIGLTPNAITTIGLILNIGVAVIFVFGAEKTNRGDMAYVGWAGALVLFAGLFDMLDGQVARLGNMSSTFGALYDSVLDRYSELVMFLGICYYLVAHHYFLSSLFAFIALIGSMMVSYTRARAEGLGVECKGGLMQRPERVVLIGVSAIACGIAGHYIGGDYRLFVSGIPFHVFETMSIFTIPITVMAIMTNITAFGRLRDAKRALDTKDRITKESSNAKATFRPAVASLLLVTLCATALQTNARNTDISDAFPVPTGIPRLMFYIQRTHNINTICYELNETAHGAVDDENPVHVFWMRYADDGSRKELNFIQRKFAYGLRTKKLTANNYELRSVAYAKRPMYLRKATDNNFYVYTTIASRNAVLNRIFIKIDGGTFWSPNVVYLELKGRDVATGETIIERVKP